MDPSQYAEKLILVFSEKLHEAKVISTKPEFPFTAQLAEDTSIFEIRFSNYTLPYEEKFVIELEATDLAGNKGEDEYSFITKAKE